MKQTLLNSIRISDFELSEEALQPLGERTVVVTKWNWDYLLAHRFQRASLELVQATPHLRILICCSHPEVLTFGRGLQRPRKGENLGLTEFNPENFDTLPYPLHRVERGGGLTFHHPGQFIFYPILKLNPKSLSLSRMTDEIFDLTGSVLESWGLRGSHHEHKLFGLWNNNRKLASMGIAVERLTTFHGMALNIYQHLEMQNTLKQLSPCGLSPETYTSVEALNSLPENALEVFRDQFLKRIDHEWK